MNDDDLHHRCVIAYLSSDIEGVVYSVISRAVRREDLPHVLPVGLNSGFQEFIIRPGVPEAIRNLVQQAEQRLRRDNDGEAGTASGIC